jgi:hypothetical protein
LVIAWVATVARPDTILAWYRKLVVRALVPQHRPCGVELRTRVAWPAAEIGASVIGPGLAVTGRPMAMRCPKNIDHVAAMSDPRKANISTARAIETLPDVRNQELAGKNLACVKTSVRRH